MNPKFIMYISIGIIAICLIALFATFYSSGEEPPTLVISGNIVREYSLGGNPNYGFETTCSGVISWIPGVECKIPIHASFQHIGGPGWFGFFGDILSDIKGDWKMTGTIKGVKAECRIPNPDGFIIPNMQGVSNHEWILKFYGLPTTAYQVGEEFPMTYTITGSGHIWTGSLIIEWKWLP